MQVKLIDFGISRIKSEQASYKFESGTSLYNSPEQIRGESLDCRSDMYSFGVTAFELITGLPPFDSKTHHGAMQSHFFQKVPSAMVRNRLVSPTVDRMIRICMKKEKNDRYATMKEVINRIQLERRGIKARSLLERVVEPLLNFIKC